MKVLLLTNMYPNKENPLMGIFVQEQVESLRNLGVEIDVLLVNGRKSKINYIWGFFRLWGRLLTRHYDLIHAHYVFPGIIARAQFLLPVVLTHHGLEVFTGWQRIPSRWLTPQVDRVILVSREQQEKLGNKNTAIIPCGIDFNLFRPMPQGVAREKLGLPVGKKLVLWAGDHNRPEKRYDIVQEALAIAKKRDPFVELVLVSEQPHDIIPVYMNACDVLFLVSNAEGSPMVIKEAMACNLPVVSVPVGDVPEVIGGTDGCYLCRQDPSDVAEKLGLALSYSKRTNGREKITSLEISFVAQRILTLYQEVVHEKRKKS